MALKKVKGTLERVLDKNLQDLVRGIRNHKEAESKYIAECIDEIKQELRQDNLAGKANAVNKLIYLQMLGYDISWAAFNVIEVMSSAKFTHKRIGYLAASQSFHEGTDVLMLTTNMIRKDLSSQNMYDAGVALNGLSCFVSPDLARDLANDIMTLMTSTKPYLRKKAVLIMYKVFLKFPEALRPAFPRLKEKLEDPDPGAISNRTLEHLTESSMRPCRAIRGDQRQYAYTGPSYDQNPYGAGIIGDRSGLNMQPQTTSTSSSSGGVMDIFNVNRSMSPSDSDTSGVSSGSEFSETALMDLMNSLHLTQPTPHCQYPMLNSQSSGQASGGSNNGMDGISPTLDILKVLGLQSDIPLQRQASTGPYHQPLYNDFSMSADLFASRPWTSLNTLFSTSATDPYSIERAAKLYRNAATISEPTCTWSGQLPAKAHRNPVYSYKVFLGGVPWDITETGLQSCFRTFGPLKIEWPGKDGKHPRYPTKGKELPVGYVYILFESERSVRALLQACTHDFTNGGEYYYKISSRRMRSKEVQVIPWIIGDSNYVKNPSQRLDPQKTVFVGALHGMLNAEGLAHILNDLFGNVVYSGIDTDKHKYPIGSGRVTFSSHKSYVKAVTAAFVEIKTAKFTKKIQIDPYLEESPCNVCLRDQGPYFCRDFKCFRYYCRGCWQSCHSAEGTRFHKPLMRNNISSGISSVVEATMM